MAEIPESAETRAARDVLAFHLNGEVGHPGRVAWAISVLIEAKIVDAIEFMADRAEEQVATLSASQGEEK